MLKLMQELADDPPPLLEAARETGASPPQLSPRELQIVQYVLFDEKERTIAARLGISAHTVHTYLKRIYAKLGVRSRVELVARVCGEYAAWIRLGGGPRQTDVRLAVRRAA